MDTDRLFASVHYFDDHSHGRLSPQGLAVMSKLGELTLPHAHGRRGRILTSTWPQAIESTQELARILKPASVEQHTWLLSGKGVSIAAILEQVLERSVGFDMLTVVAGGEIAETLCVEYARQIHRQHIVRAGHKGMARIVTKEGSFFLDGNDTRVSNSVPSDR